MTQPSERYLEIHAEKHQIRIRKRKHDDKRHITWEYYFLIRTHGTGTGSERHVLLTFVGLHNEVQVYLDDKMAAELATALQPQLEEAGG